MSVNKVLLIGNLGQGSRGPLHGQRAGGCAVPARDQRDLERQQRTAPGAHRVAPRRGVGKAGRAVRRSTSRRAARSTSRAGSGPASTTTRTATSATSPRSSRSACSSSAAAAAGRPARRPRHGRRGHAARTAPRGRRHSVLTRPAPSLTTTVPLGHAGVAALADDHVVEDADADQLAGTAQPLGECGVLGRWRGVAARVVVHQHQRRGSEPNGRKEHLARVDQRSG